MERVPSRIDRLIADMTLAEKAGQLTQYFYFQLPADAEAEPALGLDRDAQPREVEAALAQGAGGSLLFTTDPAEINRLQRLAVKGHRHGSPARMQSESTLGVFSQVQRSLPGGCSGPTLAGLGTVLGTPKENSGERSLRRALCAKPGRGHHAPAA